MTANICVLKNAHKGAVVFVVASGASMNFLPKQIFDGAVVVAVNEMWQHVPATYAVMHHHERAQEVIDAGVKLVASERDWGSEKWGQLGDLHGNFYTYRTGENNMSASIDVEALERDTLNELVVSPCSTSEAMQFAAHLGASVIVCCGIDEATLDGRMCVEGYNNGNPTTLQHVRLMRPIISATVAALRRKGVGVCSLSPFVGFGHEGHVIEE